MRSGVASKHPECRAPECFGRHRDASRGLVWRPVWPLCSPQQRLCGPCRGPSSPCSACAVPSSPCVAPVQPPAALCRPSSACVAPVQRLRETPWRSGVAPRHPEECLGRHASRSSGVRFNKIARQIVSATCIQEKLTEGLLGAVQGQQGDCRVEPLGDGTGPTGTLLEAAQGPQGPSLGIAL